MKRVLFAFAFYLSIYSLQAQSSADTTLSGQPATTGDTGLVVNDSLHVKGDATVQGYLITKHVRSPDGVIHLGDSSMTFTSNGPVTNPITSATNVYYESMGTSGTTGGIGIGWSSLVPSGHYALAFGNGAKAYGDYSNVLGSGGAETDGNFSTGIGWNVKTSSAATYGIVLGSGYVGNPMINSTANSLAVGFNSNVPTFFVGPAAGSSGSLGKVGIGTTNPLVQLSVNGDALFTNTTGTPSSAAYIRGNSAVSAATNPEYSWYGDLTTGIFHPATGIIAFTKSGAETMRIHSNGMVGIGKTSPASKLDIVSASQIGLQVTTTGGVGYNTILTMDNEGLYRKALAVQLSNKSYAETFVVYANGATLINASEAAADTWAPLFTVQNQSSGTIKTLFTVGSDGSTIISAATNGSPFKVVNTNLPGTGSAQIPFEINGSGQVFIGTKRVASGPHTNSALTVAGKVSCQEVRVFTNATAAYWADYVFDKNYALMGLDKLEAFYKENKHLPGVPTTKEIEENGNELAKTDAILLSKIEENTLYIVELNKKLEKLQAENAELKTLIKKQQN